MSVEKICRVPEGSVFSYVRKIGERWIWKSENLTLEINPGIPNQCFIDHEQFVYFSVKCPSRGTLEMYLQYSMLHDDFDEETAFGSITLKGTPEACYTLTLWDEDAYKIKFNK